MNMITARWLILCLALLVFCQALQFPYRHVLVVDGEKRTAWVYPGIRAAGEETPLVLVFHGFKGRAWNMARGSRLHVYWPQATVAYAQGLPVLKPSTGLWAPGWQDEPGKYGDRDLRFVDLLLDDLQQHYQVNPERIYVAGHSNGATFTYLLHTKMPERFAAFAGVAGAAPFAGEGEIPRPAFIMHCPQDERVPFSQAEDTRDKLLKGNRSAPRPTELSPDEFIYAPIDASGAPVHWLLYDEGHHWPSKASPAIVRFFQSY